MPSCRLLIVVAVLAGCAGRRTESKIAPSSDSASYALRYGDDLERATAQLNDDKREARARTAALPARAREVKAGSEPGLIERIVDESDRAGRTRSYVDAQRSERELRAFWEQERGPIGSRVASAAQKEVQDKGCTQEIDLGGSVQHALRDGIDRQLERRGRAENEAQRTLELNKGRIAPGSFPTLQRLSDEIANASHVTNVALFDDAHELERLLDERSGAERTLARMLEEERALQSGPHTAVEQRASQDRVVQIEKARAAVEAKVASAQAALRDHQEQVRAAQAEYDHTIEAIKAGFRVVEPRVNVAASAVKPSR